MGPLMADDHLLTKVHGLSDLELAGLLCLMSREHCLISTPQEALGELIDELQLVSTKTFGLQCAIVNCHAETTLDDFAAAILLPSTPAISRSHSASGLHQNRNGSTNNHNNGGGPDSYFVPRPGALTPLTTLPGQSNPAQEAHKPGNNNHNSSASTIANVIIARNLDLAPKPVQIQALELLRTRRIFTRTSVQPAPKQFLFIAALAARSGGEAKVTPHLNDMFYLAHWHDPEDGFANLDDEEMGGNAHGSETGSIGSVVRKNVNEDPVVSREPVLSDVDLVTLAKLSDHVQIDIDVVRYQMNIVSHLRMHRAVAGGISPTATKHFEQLTKCLAPLHSLEYVTPGLVALAVKKVYLHRIQITSPERERSMQWGSQLEAVEALLEDYGPEDVMEEVIASVATPL